MGSEKIKSIIFYLTKRFSIFDFSLNQSQIREISWLSGGQFITLLLSLVSIKLMTSIGPYEFGKIVLATSIGVLFSLVFFGPVEQGFVRIYFDYTTKPATRNIFLWFLLRILGYSFLGLIVLGGVVIFFGSVFFSIDIFFFIASGMMVILTVIVVPVNGIMNAMRLRREVSLIQIMEKILIITVILLAKKFFHLNAAIMVSSICIAIGISLIIRVWVYIHHSGPGNPVSSSAELVPSQVRKSIYEKVIKYSFPFFLWGGVSWLQLNGERWMINGLLARSDVGRYGLATSLINNSAILLFNILSQFITPIVFNRFSSDQVKVREMGMDLIRLYSWITFFLFLGFAVILFFVGEWIIHLLSTPDFILNGPFLFVLTLGLGMFYLAQTKTLVGMCFHKPEIYLKPKVVTSLFSIVAYTIGCLYGGILGVAAGIMVVNSFYYIMVVKTNYKFLQTNAVS